MIIFSTEMIKEEDKTTKDSTHSFLCIFFARIQLREGDIMKSSFSTHINYSALKNSPDMYKHLTTRMLKNCFKS